MKKMVWLAVAMAAVMALVGCSRKEGASAEMEAYVESTAPALTPQEACEKAAGDMIQALKEADLPALFELLPASRQQDVRDFVAAFAQAVPEPLWTEVAATGTELLDTLRTQLPNLVGLAQESAESFQNMLADMADDSSAVSPGAFSFGVLANEPELTLLGDALADVFSVSRQDMLEGKVEKLFGSKAVCELLQTVMRESEGLMQYLPVSFEVKEAEDEDAAGDAGQPVFGLKTFIGDGSTEEDIVVCVDGKWIVEGLNEVIRDSLQEAIREMREAPISEETAAEAIEGLRKIRESLPMIKAAPTPDMLRVALLGAFMSAMGGLD